jgi:hypothetical protein
LAAGNDESEGVDLKKLREIARTHIEKAAAGDMQAIKELRDTLDGKPAQTLLEHAVPENGGIRKIVHEIVQWPPGQNLTIDNELPADDEPWHDNGKDGAN